MKVLDLNAYGVCEMSAVELQNVGGGKWEYLTPSWSGTNNELIYAIETCENAIKYLYNGLAWCVNKIFY